MSETYINATTLNGIPASEFVKKSQLRQVIGIDDDGNITGIDSTKFINKINKNVLPNDALVKCVTVETEAAKLKLTVADVQNGDFVKVTESSRTYLVTQDSNLNSEAGYTELIAASAGSVEWAGVQNKPSTLSGYGLANEIQEKVNTRAPKYTYGTEDLVAGESMLTTGTLYFMYE